MTKQFSLTGQMVEHLMLLQDDDVLGRALCALFNTKVKDYPFSCRPEDNSKMGFVMALLADDMKKAERNVNRMRTVREQLGTVQNGSQRSPFPLEKEKNEREISPHTPYIEKESKERDNPPSLSAHTRELDSAFDRFWSEYPRKVAKQDAYKAFHSVMRTVKNVECEINAWISALGKQKKSHDWTKDDGKFVPYPATWIRGFRWLDVIDAEQEQGNESPAFDDVNSETERRIFGR